MNEEATKFDLRNIVAWLFCGYVVLLPIVRPLSVARDGVLIQFADIFFLLIFLIWLGGVLIRRIEFPHSPLVFAVGILLAAFVVSTVFSAEPFKSSLKLIGVFYLAAIALVAGSVSRDPAAFRLIVFSWLTGTAAVVLGTFSGLAAFLLGSVDPGTNFFLSHQGSLPAGNYPRIRSFFENANMMANYLNVSSLFALMAGAFGWLRSLLVALLIAGISFAAFFTLSPGIGGIFLSVAIWIWATRLNTTRLYRNSAFVAGSLLAAFIFLSTVVSPASFFGEKGKLMPVSDWHFQPSVRVSVWNDSIRRGINSPFLGRGTGADAANIYYRTVSGQGQLIRDAHNAWLNIFGQTGLIGLAAFLYFSFIVWRMCRFDIHQVHKDAVVLVGLSCAVVGAFFYQNLFGSYEDARHLWVLIGMLAAVSTWTVRTRTEPA